MIQKIIKLRRFYFLKVVSLWNPIRSFTLKNRINDLAFDVCLRPAKYSIRFLFKYLYSLRVQPGLRFQNTLISYLEYFSKRHKFIYTFLLFFKFAGQILSSKTATVHVCIIENYNYNQRVYNLPKNYFRMKLLFSCKKINANHFKLSKLKNWYQIIFFRKNGVKRRLLPFFNI